jgi:hypothetical protein
MRDYYQHNERGARSCREFARRYGQDALQLELKFKENGKNYGNAVFMANIVLGMVVMRIDGDIKSAARHLLAASETTSAEHYHHVGESRRGLEERGSLHVAHCLAVNASPYSFFLVSSPDFHFPFLC